MVLPAFTADTAVAAVVVLNHDGTMDDNDNDNDDYMLRLHTIAPCSLDVKLVIQCMYKYSVYCETCRERNECMPNAPKSIKLGIAYLLKL